MKNVDRCQVPWTRRTGVPAYLRTDIRFVHTDDITAAKSKSDDEIDRLYQLPLEEFTAARNALAKERGPDGADVRALQKPALSAWAVNQLYWHRRATYAKLIAAAYARRQAHAKRLRGESSDIDAAEQAHAAALRAAANEIRALLADAGKDPTSATMIAVTETLQALPGSAPPGRLVQPLKLVGFEALAGLVPASERTLRALTPPPPVERPARSAKDDPGAARREAAQAKRADEARRRELAAATKQLRAAQRESRQAEGHLNAARRELVRAKDARDRLQDQLQFALKQIDDAAGVVRRQEDALGIAERERVRLEAKVRALRDRE